MTNDLTLAPFAAEGDWHSVLARYVLCARWARGRRVLDLTCGRGVGCETLRRLGAAHVVGVDTRDEVVRWAQHQFGGERITFEPMESGGRLPFADGSFDLVLCLSTLWTPGREHLREVRRVLDPRGTFVLAQAEGHSATLGELLPVYDRPPPSEGRDPADAAFRDSLFGEALSVVEVPSLTVHYRMATQSARSGHWPRAERTLSESGAPPTSSARLHVYGLSDADTKATTARVIELPYYDVTGQLARDLDAADREVEVLRHNLRLTEEELSEKETLVADLDAEARSLRQELADVRDEMSDMRSQTITHESSPSPSHSPSPSRAPARYDREREAYIAQLWQSLTAWQRHAESLENELETRLSAGPIQADLSPGEPTPTEPPAAPGASATEREEELSRLLEATEEALQSSRLAEGEAQRTLARARDELARAREEVRQRELRQRELEAEIEQSNLRWEQASEEMAEVLDQKGQLEREVAAAERKLSEVSVKQDKAKLDEVTLEREIRQKSASIQTLEREMMGMNVELASRERENNRLMRAKANFDRDQQALRAQLSEAQAAAETARAEAEAARAQAEAARAQAEAARAQAEAARAQAVAAPAEAEAEAAEAQTHNQVEIPLGTPAEEATDKAEAENPDAPTVSEQAGDAPVPKKRRKRKARTKKDDAAKAEPNKAVEKKDDGAKSVEKKDDAAETKPKPEPKPGSRRTRTKKAAEKKDDDAPKTEEETPKPKRRRTRAKKAAPKADSAASAAKKDAPAKPRRKRRRKKPEGDDDIPF